MSLVEAGHPNLPIIHGILGLRDDVEAVLEYPSLDNASSISFLLTDDALPWFRLDVFWGFGSDQTQKPNQKARIAFILQSAKPNDNSDLLFVNPEANAEHDCSLFPINPFELKKLRTALKKELNKPPSFPDKEGERLRVEGKIDQRVLPRRDLAFRTIIQTLQKPTTPRINRGLGTVFSPLKSGA